MRVEIDDHSEFDQERLYLCQLITNTDMLREVYQQFDPDLLSSEYARIVGKWIKQHYKETHAAPGKDLQTIFSRRSVEIRDKDVVKNISLLLKSLSSDWEKYRIVNTQYNTKALIQYLDEQNARRFLEDVQNAVEGQDFKKVPTLAANYKKIQAVSSSGESLFDNPYGYKDAFDQSSQRLFRMQGALGDVCGWFRRGEFSSIAAQTKGGKTFFKNYGARRAMTAGENVAYFNLEMNTKMFRRRRFQEMAACPAFTKDVRIGYFDDSSNIQHKIQRMRGASSFTAEEIEKKIQNYKRLYKGNIYGFTYPRGTATLSDMKADVRRLWEYQGIEIGLIIIDYMDIIAAEDKYRDPLDNENALWRDTAAWAEEDNVGILSSTQGNLDSFDGKSFGAKAVGGVYKKLSHTDKLLALYSGTLDQKQGITRVRRLYDRDDGPKTEECVVITGMDIGRFYMDSRMATEIGNLEMQRNKRGSGRR